MKRSAGILYLIVIAAGFFANAIARDLSSETLFRAGIAAQIVMYACYTGVTAIFFNLFKPASPTLSLFAASLSLTGIAIGGVDALLDAAALLHPAFATALLRLHGAGFSLALAFFGSYLMTLGVLILRSRAVPRILGALLMLEGLCFLVFKLTGLVAPAAQLPSSALLAASLAEVSLALWLVFRSSGPPATSRS